MKDRSRNVVDSYQFIPQASFDLFFNNIQEEYFLIDRKLSIIAANNAAKETCIKKLQVKLVIGMSLFDILSPDKAALFAVLIKHAFIGNTKKTESELRGKEGKGEMLYFENLFAPVYNNEGEVAAVIVRLHDITEKKRMERRLKESEEWLQFALESAKQGAWDWNIKTGEVNFSFSYRKTYGFDDTDLPTTFDSWNSRVHPEDRDKIQFALDQHLSGLTPVYECTYRLINKHGGYQWILGRGKINSRDTDGTPLRMCGTHTDLTESIHTQKELKKIQERFTYAAKAASQALWEWNALTGEAYVSPSFTEMFGWESDRNKRFEQWHVYIHPDDREATIESYYSTLKNPDKNIWECAYRFRRADGSYAIVNDRAFIIRDEKSLATKVIGATEDITVQKRTEAELHKSNERFLLAGKATSDALYDVNFISGELYWGPGMQTLFGHSPEIVSIQKWESLIHEEDRKKTAECLRSTIESEKAVWKASYRFANSDGRYKHVVDNAFIIRDDLGNAQQMIGSLQDVTETKQNESLASLEKDVFELSSDITLPLKTIVETFLRGIESLYPDAFTSVLLINEDDTLSPLCAPRLPEAYLASIKGIKFNSSDGSCCAAMVQKHIVIADNIETDRLWTNYKNLALQYDLKACWSLPILDSNGGVIGSLGMYFKYVKSPSALELQTMERIQNILRILMEHYNSLKKIKEANERFDNMMQATHDILWDWNMEENRIFRSQRGPKNADSVKRSNAKRTVDKWIERIHPDDQAKAIAIIKKMEKGYHQQTFELEYRFQKNDGSYTHVYDRGILVTDEKGKPIRMIGAAQDISERKRLEAELLKNELEYQKLINQASVDSQEQERTEIGKELHDNINQVLTTTKLYLELALNNEDMMKDLVKRSSKTISNVITEIRQLSRSLMDPSIGDLGIVDSIYDLIENINLTQKIVVSLEINEHIANVLDKKQKLTVYRIIQESLSNVIRHAQAREAKIKINMTETLAELSISDDGKGFERNLVKKGAGLKNITNRVYLINGNLNIKTTPGQGCTIQITFPVTTNNY